MFNLQQPEKTSLDEAIENAHSELASYQATDENYAITVTQLSHLYELKRKQAPERLSKDTLAIVTANLLGIVMILHHEQVNVITSKAMAFIPKLK